MDSGPQPGKNARMAPRRRACLVGACVLAMRGCFLSQPGGGRDRAPGLTTARVAAFDLGGQNSPIDRSAGGSAAAASGPRATRTALPRWVPASSNVRVPILYYHRVQAPPAG